jgi:hypothetical protein
MKIFTSYLLSRMVVTLAAVILFILISGQNAQALTYWTNSSGSATNFDWANGGSNNGLFGDPNPVGDTLAFSPSNFSAQSSDGLTDFVSDTLEFELTAHPGLSFKSITITEECDYVISVLDEENGQGSVQATATLSINNLDTSDVLGNLIIDSTPIGSSSYLFGIWEPEAELNINQQDWTHIKITLTNDLKADTTGLGSNALIEKKEFGTTISIQMVPEPATIGLLALGSLVLLGKKK